MEHAIVIVRWAKDEPRTDQVMIAAIGSSDGTGAPDPSTARVCLLRGTHRALTGGRGESTFLYDPSDPRQVRAAEGARAASGGEAP